MAKNGFKVMDSDMHVIEPVDLWERYIDRSFKERAPLGITRFQGDMLLEIEGRRLIYSSPNPRYDAWEMAKAKLEHARRPLFRHPISPSSMISF